MIETATDVSDRMQRAGQLALGFGCAIILMLIGSAAFSFFGITRPMTRLNSAMNEMAEGHLDVVIPGAGRGDEIGDIAKTIVVVRDNAERKARGAAETKIRKDEAVAELRRADMHRLAEGFESAGGLDRAGSFRRHAHLVRRAVAGNRNCGRGGLRRGVD